MKFGLMNTKVYAKEFTLSECAPGEMEINIENGSIDIDISHMVKDLCKSEREKVWEMAEHILRIPYTERLKYFGTSQVFDILSMPVDKALDRYEAWKKANTIDALIKSLEPQDVVAFKLRCCDTGVGMVTRIDYSRINSIPIAIVHSDGVVDEIFFPEDVEHIEKIGRVVEATDILGTIRKIEDEWRKDN